MVNVPGNAPAAEGIFVQLLLSGMEIIDTRHVNSGFDRRSHFVAVSEFVEAGSVENRNFSTFSPHPHSPTDFKALSV